MANSDVLYNLLQRFIGRQQKLEHQLSQLPSLYEVNHFSKTRSYLAAINRVLYQEKELLKGQLKKQEKKMEMAENTEQPEPQSTLEETLEKKAKEVADRIKRVDIIGYEHSRQNEADKKVRI